MHNKSALVLVFTGIDTTFNAEITAALNRAIPTTLWRINNMGQQLTSSIVPSQCRFLLLRQGSSRRLKVCSTHGQG